MTSSPLPAAPHVHLFHGNTLLGTVPAGGKSPLPQYELDGVTYRCISYMEIMEPTGDRGFDAQVAPISS